MKRDSLLSLFIATLVFVVILLVAYILIFWPSCVNYSSYLSNGNVKGIRHFGKRKVINDYQSDLTDVCDKDKLKEADRESFMSFIPDFKHSVGQTSLHKLTRTSSNISLPYVSPCKDNFCSEHLSSEGRSRFCSCVEYASAMKPVPTESQCQFMDGRFRDPVALVSFPGSGNTWVRSLLESTTRICTGAIYCDVSLRTGGFTGEFVRDGSVLVVKTHENNPIWTDSTKELHEYQGRFGSAIFIVRNPLHSLVAEWNRKVANNFTVRTTNLESHTHSAGREWFGENERWQDYVSGQARRWMSMLIRWVIKNRTYPVLLVKYESLQNDTVSQVKRILDFLGVHYGEQHVEGVLKKQAQMFHRRHSKDFDPYTPAQRSYVRSIVDETITLIEKSKLSDLIDINDYL